MSDDIKKSIKRLEEVSRCFVKLDDEYRLHDRGGNLPMVHNTYEPTLKKLKIAYVPVKMIRRDGVEIFLKYWDRNVYEEYDETLPCYEYQKDCYVYIGKVTKKIPSKKTVEAALALKEKLSGDFEYVRQMKCYRVLQNKMNGRCAAYVHKKDFKAAQLYEGQVRNFFVFVNKKEDGSQWNDIVIFDLNKIYKENVTLEIPERYSNRILGENQKNAKDWIDVLGIDGIEIVYT